MLTEKQEATLITIYKKLFQYKHLLPNAPALTMNLEQLDSQTVHFSSETIEQETKKMIAYLLGLTLENLSVKNIIRGIKAHYQKDDFWRNLLIDYVELAQEQDEQNLQEKRQETLQETMGAYNQVLDFKQKKKDFIHSFGEKIKKNNFPVNGERLISNYLNMSNINLTEAWDIITSNPAFFSPIIVCNDKGDRILSIKQAKKANENLAHFLKKIKA